LRIIAGDLRGRKVELLPLSSARPTPDRVRESMFNMLAGRMRGCRFLDLFAGSGIVGMEAISRGAGYVTFCDQDRRGIAAIQRYLDQFGVPAQKYRLHSAAYDQALERLSGDFNVIFMDPPYASGFYAPASMQIVRRRLLAPDGILVWECDRGTTQVTVEGLVEYDRRVYGSTSLIFLRAE